MTTHPVARCMFVELIYMLVNNYLPGAVTRGAAGRRLRAGRWRIRWRSIACAVGEVSRR